MQNLLQTIAAKIAIPVAFVASLFGYNLLPPEPTPAPMVQTAPTLGAYNPSGGGTYRLSGSIGTTNTSITLSSFKEPVSNTLYTMAYLNSDIVFGTLDPQTNVSEFISFTGITQNADGSATLTGVTRGLNRTNVSDTCSASSVFKQPHSGQSVFILSNSPCLYGQYVTKVNDETITGIKTFASTSIPKVATNTTLAQISASTTNFVTVGLLTATAFGSSTVSVASGGTGATSLTGILVGNGTSPFTSTSTPYGLAFNTSSTTATSTFVGHLTVNNNFYATGTSTFTGSTTIPATQTNRLTLNGQPYSIQSNRAASSTVLVTDGNNNLTFGSAVTFKNGNDERVGDAASGSQTIAHGLGTTPKFVSFSAAKVIATTGMATSEGSYNGTTNISIQKLFITAATPQVNPVSAVITIWDEGTGSNKQVAVASWDATNITLTWTKTGAPSSNTITFLWTAVK